MFLASVNRVVVLPLWFSISGSTTISCSSYDNGGVVVVGSVDCRTAGVSVTEVGGKSSSSTTTSCLRAWISLCGGFGVTGNAGLTASKVLAAIAAGGGAADTIGPPVTTGEATALVACVVAIAVADVDAVTEDDGAAVAVTAVVGVVVTGTGAAIIGGAVADDDDNEPSDVDVVTVDATDVVATVVETPGVVADVVVVSACVCVPS